MRNRRNDRHQYQMENSNPSPTTALHFIQFCQPRYDFTYPQFLIYAHTVEKNGGFCKKKSKHDGKRAAIAS
jgi:hypothetical protein